MILVDSRAGSHDLVKPLLAMGLPVEETHLEFGDLCFIGRGEKGAPLLIGIEHKRLSDLVQSLNGRLPGHQLPGMVQTYDRSWLIVERNWHRDTRGRVTVFKGHGRQRVKGAPPAMVLLMRLLVMNLRGGIGIWPSPNRRHSLDFIAALYRTWTDKDLDEHKSHLAIYAPDLDRGLCVPVSVFRQIVAQIPGVGLRTSTAVEARFGGSFRRMMLAPIAEWAEIATIDDRGKTKRIGLLRAKTIMEALQ